MKSISSWRLGLWLCLGAVLFLGVAATRAQSGAPTNAPAITASEKTAVALDEEAPVRLTFWLNQVEPLRQPIFGYPAWEYIALGLYLFGALLFSRLLNHLVGARIQEWVKKSPNTIDDWTLRLAHGPLKLIIFVIFLHIGLQVFHWPDSVAHWLTKILHVVVAIALTFMCLRLVDLLMGRFREKSAGRDDSHFNDQLFPIISRSIKAFLIVVAVLVTADNLGVNIRSALAGLSIGGLALGLAAQDTFANIFGAVAVFIDKPFQLGDQIKIDAFEGTVESMGLRSTRIRSPEGHLITVPNKTMGNAAITNITRRPNFKTTMNLGLNYDTPSDKVQEAIAILQEILSKNPLTHDIIISFDKFGASSLNIQVAHWMKTNSQKEYLNTLQEINLVIKERFDAARIAFAFPTQTIFLKQGSEWRLLGAQVPGSKQLQDRS